MAPRNPDPQRQEAPSNGRARRPRTTRGLLGYVVRSVEAARAADELRLEMGGGWKGWTIPQGISTAVGERRLAIRVRESRDDDADFDAEREAAANVPSGVRIRDRGIWIPESNPLDGYKRGELTFKLQGRRLRGRWNLSRAPRERSDDADRWILVKVAVGAVEPRDDPEPAPGRDNVRRPPGGRISRARRAPAVTVAGVTITHPERVLYVEQGITKQQLADYYERVADLMLPHVARRPLSLVRCPQGQGGSCFYQRNFVDASRVGGAIHTQRVHVAHEDVDAPYIVDVAGLVSLAQLGVLEIHPWGATISALDRPDRLIFDLDPGPKVPWPDVVAAARALRAELDRVGLRGFVRTSGGKGLHVVVPLAGRTTWATVEAFAAAVAERLVARAPTVYTTKPAKAEREAKIFVDTLRNHRGATAVAPYSTRAKPGAPVSTPLSWDELTTIPHAAHFNVVNFQQRLATRDRDPWDGFFAVRQTITRERLAAVEQEAFAR